MGTVLRRTGLSVLGNVPWGTHLCIFHETKQDLLDALVPYFGAGLESKEFCVWVVAEPLTVEEAMTALRREVPALDRALDAGSIEILPGREWYLPKGTVDPKKIIGGWREKLDRALARGGEGLRVSGNAFWLASKYWRDFRQYEHELDLALEGQPMIVLCTYPLAASRPADILDVAHAHTITVVRRNGEWEFVETAEAPTTTHSLTPRELEVLTWVARGKSAWEIGEILDIAKRTVDEHAQTAVRKIGAANRTQAVAIALRSHLIEP